MMKLRRAAVRGCTWLRGTVLVGSDGQEGGVRVEKFARKLVEEPAHMAVEVM